MHTTVSAADQAGGSGVAETGCALDPATVPASFADLPAGCAYTGAGATVTTDGEHVIYAAGKDTAGNSETPVRRAFKLDQAGATVTATVTDATSGPAQNQISAAADTASAGAKTATVTGTDNAGNQATAGCGYHFGSFAQPVDNLDAEGDPLLNVVKAGRAIPLKWRLTDSTGAPVSTLTSAQITVVGISCTAGATTDQVEETAAGASGLQKPRRRQLPAQLEIPHQLRGSCKRLRLDLGEGSHHTADFKFTTNPNPHRGARRPGRAPRVGARRWRRTSQPAGPPIGHP